MKNIKNYPVSAFFLFTFAVSWGLFFVYILFPNEISLLLLFIAIYAPAGIALIISRKIGVQENNEKRKLRWLIFIIIWSLATLTFIINSIMKLSTISLIMIIGAVFLGLLPAFMISSGLSKNSEIKMVFQSYIRPKGHFIWYLVAILLMPISLLLGAIVTILMGQSVTWVSFLNIFELIGLIAITFLYTFFYGAGTNEEPGWRGFALPRLQLKFSPLLASLILGLIWGFWHTPIYLPQYDSIFQYAIFLLNTVKIAVILTWLYNRTGGSVLATALLHTIGNISFEFLPATFASDFIQIAIMTVFILTDRMWKKKKELNHLTH
jgi:membrane protease YdiL (CAAX protease family)